MTVNLDGFTSDMLTEDTEDTGVMYEHEMGPPSDPPNLREVARDAMVEAMVEWFFENFEDPAEHTPYDCAEGGYQYIWGGPCTADEVIHDTFDGKTSQRAVREAVERIDRDGFLWVPSQSRMQPTEPMQPIEPINSK
jgi:hypothetical protein